MTTWKGAGGGNNEVDVFANGVVDLHQVTTISEGTTIFQENGGQINLAGLTSFTGTYGGRGFQSSLFAYSGGTIAASQLTTLNNVDVELGGTGLPTSQITTLTNAEIRVFGGVVSFPGLTTVNTLDLYVSDGGRLNLPNVTSYDASGRSDYNPVLQAEGAGSLLDLHNVTSWKGTGNATDDSRRVMVSATRSGVVDLHQVTTISQGNTSFDASDPGSQINLAGLTSISGAYPARGSRVNYLSGLSGGVIAAGNLTTLNNFDLYVAGTGVPTSQITTMTNSLIEVRGGAQSFPGLSTINTLNLTVRGGRLNWANITSYDASGLTYSPRLEAAGGMLDLSSVTSWRGAGSATFPSSAEVFATGGVWDPDSGTVSF